MLSRAEAGDRDVQALVQHGLTDASSAVRCVCLRLLGEYVAADPAVTDVYLDLISQRVRDIAQQVRHAIVVCVCV